MRTNTHILIVDDLRTPTPDFQVPAGCDVHVATSSDAALAHLDRICATGQTLSALYLDHDLGQTPDGRTLTIMPVVDFLVQQAFHTHAVPVDTIFVHTSNPVGRRNIMMALTTTRIGGAYRVIATDSAAAGLAYQQQTEHE